MPLRVGDLLADPELGLELVAGRRGLDERGPISWAHISELPDPAPWLEGGELLLLTGLGVRDSEEAQRRLVAGLDERGCAAIGFGVGVLLDQVPPALVAEADARRLPLFTVPYEVPFLAITKKVSEHVAAEHYGTLRAAVDLHRAVLAAVVGGRGLSGVLRTVTAPMPGFGALVLDADGGLLAQHDPAGALGRLDTSALWRSVVPHPARRFSVRHEGHTVTGAPVRVTDEVEATLLLVGPRSLSEPERLLLEQGLAGLTLELARGASAREARRTRLEELLEDAAGASDGTPLERGLRRLGFDAAEYHVLCVRRPRHLTERALCGLVEDVLGVDGPPLAGRFGGDVVCLVTGGVSTAAERIVAAARERGWRSLQVGRSRPARGAGALTGAIKEAVAAAGHQDDGGVRDIAALGLPGVVTALRTDPAAAAFVEQVLGAVLRHDRREAPPLVPTLRAYLAHGCRPGPAAAELRIHRHTLAYRLDRIRELSGRDPREGGALLEFGLALELLPLVEHA
jgi:purine catabolism regulator